MYRRKFSFRRLGVLLLLAVVGFGTYSTAYALVGPEGVNEGIKLWLVADKSDLYINRNCSGLNPTSGADIKCWKDRSGNNANVTVKNIDGVTGIGSNFGRPTYLEDKIGGEPVLRFKKSERDGLVHKFASSWTSDYTIFLVVQNKWSNLADGGLKNRTYFSSGKDFQHSLQIGHGKSNQRKSVWVWVQNDRDRSTKFEPNNNYPRLYAVRDGPDTRTTYTDGALNITDTINNNGRTFSRYQINLNRNGRKSHNSYIAEVILYSRNLNDCEFYDVHKYLADKYELRGDPIVAKNIPEKKRVRKELTTGDIMGDGEANYIIIDGTDSTVGTGQQIHAKADNDVVYIKGWGGNKPE